MMRRLLSILALAIGLCAMAQNPDSVSALRPVTSAWTLEWGAAELADTYLTPLIYKGNRYSIAYERSQAMRFAPERWTMQIDASVSLDYTTNRVQNSHMANAMVGLSWGMMRSWRLPYRLRAGIGPQVSAQLGAMYLGRNGNNPASAKGAVTVGPMGFLSWRTSVIGIPITLRYQASLPSIGAFFSPEYAQLYYQIYLGDRKGLAHCAWWGNRLEYSQLLTADIALGSTILRIGYRGHYISSKVNHLVTHEYSNALVVGLASDWISLSQSKHPENQRTIRAY